MKFPYYRQMKTEIGKYTLSLIWCRTLPLGIGVYISSVPSVTLYLIWLQLCVSFMITPVPVHLGDRQCAREFLSS